MSARRATALLLAAVPLVTTCGTSQGAGLDVANRPHVRIQLVPAANALVPGQPLEVALRFTLEPGWHVYWENPGVGGIATAVAWHLPTGFGAGGLRFPVPELQDVSGIRSHVHHGDVVFLTTITPPARAPLDPARLVAEVHYGICRDVCLAGSGRVTVELPWATGHVANPAWPEARALADARAPLTAGAPATSVVVKDSVAVIRVEGGDLAAAVTFFPSDQAVAPVAATVPPHPGRRLAILTLPLQSIPTGPLRGVLTIGATGWEVSLAPKQ